LIRFEEVSVRYGDEVVLDRFDLDFPALSATAVIGTSGCGKSTLLKAAAGLVRPQAGRVTVEGSTGLILQSLGLFPWKTVEKNVALALEPLGISRDEVEARTRQALDDLGLSPVARKYPGQLSGGQAQRTAIARTLVRRPDVLLMDEPSASLDALTREDFQDLVRNLHATHPTTLVVVTHGIEEAVVLGRTLVVMRRGLSPLVIDNPLYDRPDLRSEADFGAVCASLRRALA
jgi:NitT/TauT family transport system ATP-binding protein